MKRIMYAITAFLVMGFAFTGCNNDDEKIFMPKKNGTADLYGSYSYLGDIHNDFLTNVDKNFQWGNDISTFEEAIEYISDFNKDYAGKANLYDLDKNEVVEALEEYKEYYYAPNLCEDLYNGELDQDLKYLLGNGAITQSDFDLTKQVISICYRQATNAISVDEYYAELLAVEKSWKELYEQGGDVTDFTAIILNISVASAEWWIEHPAQEKLPTIVARDAAGAVVGAAGSVLSSVVTGDKVNGKAVAKSAVTSAIVASTGAVNKVAKAITSLFR